MNSLLKINAKRQLRLKMPIYDEQTTKNDLQTVLIPDEGTTPISLFENIH